LLPPVERRRWRSEHEHADEGDHERASHVRLRRICTCTTCTQPDGQSWTMRSHRQPPLGSGEAMRPIVDCRLGDVYRPRLSSHLIYAGSRHNPGCVRRSDGAGQQGGVAAVESRRAFGAISHVVGRAATFYLHLSRSKALGSASSTGGAADVRVGHTSFPAPDTGNIALRRCQPSNR
jgi:predicted RNA-binding Zn-ribbon protein involved in translation (DUF1610 family)